MTLRRQAVVSVLAAVAVAGAVGWYAYLSILRASDSARAVVQTLERVKAVDGIVDRTLTADQRARGFLATGDSVYLALLDSSRQDVPELIATLRGLVGGDPSQRARLRALAPLVFAKLRASRATAEARRPGAVAAARFAATDPNVALMEEIRRLADQMREEERVWLTQRNRELEEASARARFAILYGSGLAITLATFAAVSHVVDLIGRQRAEQALARKADELARSNADLEQFAYVASHDLQEPLRQVAGYTDLLERRYRGKLDGDADEFIGYAVDGVRRMQAMITDLLAYSRAGRAGRPSTPIASADALKEAEEALRAAIAESGAVIVKGRLPAVEADPGQLRQVFQNLLANAIKFRGVQPPRLTVSAARDGDRWRFAVADNGIGIPPDAAERIFVLFQRLHTRGEYPGTGIGLAVCKRIVEHGGGRIWVESQVGQGATFYFTLPAVGAA